MSGTTGSSASGKASYLLPAGYLSTNGSQIVDTNGNDVRIASVGWNQNFDNIPGSVAQIAAAGFNTIRLSWVDATLSSDLARIEQVVAAATANGIKVIIDHHTDESGTPADGYGSQQANGLWFDSGPGTDGTNGVGITGTVSAAQFQADWVTVAQAFAGNSTVIGFDVDNEPTSAGNINWGQGGPTDIHAMYTSVGNAIQAVDSGALIIAEGPQEYSPPPSNSGMSSTIAAPEGDLTGVASDPVVLNVANKVVYSVHEYPSTIAGTSFDSGSAMVQRLNGAWGSLVTNNVAPVWIGEMGGSLDGSADSSGSGLADEQAWATTLLDYMNGKDGSQGGPTFSSTQQGVSGDWWDWGYNPGQYPDGVLNSDGSYNAGQQAAWTQMLQKPIATGGTSVPPPPVTPPPVKPPTVTPSSDNTIVTDTKAAITDASGNKWTITSGGQVAINGAADTTTSGVIELAYVKGTIWQENSSKLWWGETQPNASWAPTTGTTISPLPAPPVTPPPPPPPPPATTPSANDTVVKAPSTAAIVDAGGNKWTITSGAQVAVNGTTDTTTSNVTELAYVNGTIWQENTNNLWWGKTQPSAAWGPNAGTSTSPLPVTQMVSANDTVVKAGSTTAIVDAGGNKWTITTGAQVAVNGSVDVMTANVTELAYVNGTIWQENSSNLWWGETQNNDAWAPSAGTATSPLPVVPVVPAPSAEDTVVVAGSTASITDASGNKWTITGSQQVAINGITDASTANVKELAYVGGEIWQENSANLWWGKTSPTASWSPNAGTSTSPLPSTITIGATQTSATINLSKVSVIATSGNHMVYITGSGDTVKLAGGTNTVSDTGSGNTYVIPAASKGYDIFTTNVLLTGDTLDLRTALAATNWTRTTSTLSKYLSVVDSTKGAVLSIAPTSGGSGVAIAAINGATTMNLTTLLTHALT